MTFIHLVMNLKYYIYSCNFTDTYDYIPGPYRVTFRAGNQQATLRINITDDDLYEGLEAFSIYIDGFLPDQVSRCEPYRSTVNILDDDRSTLAINNV